MAKASQSMILDMLKTPQQVREEQLNKIRRNSLAQAQMMGGVRGTTALPGLLSQFGQQEMVAQGVDLAKGARRASGAVGSALGMLGMQEAGQAARQAFVTPEERQASQAQNIMKNLDMTDPDAMKQAANQLQKIGLTGAANELNNRAETAVQRLLDRGYKASAEARAASGEVRAQKESELSMERTRQVMDLAREDEKRAKEAEKRAQEAEKRAKSAEERAEAEELRRVADEARKKADESRKKEEAYNKRRTLKGFGEIASSVTALKSLGFSDDLANTIANSEIKEGYYKMIEERQKQLAEKGVDGATEDTASQQEANDYLDTMNRYLALRSDENADPAELRKATLELKTKGQKYGITDSAKYEKVVADALDSSRDGTKLTAEVAALSADLEQLIVEQGDEFASGVIEAGSEELLKRAFGAEDAISVIRARYARVKNMSILSALPPGVASDRDVALVLEGTIPQDANPAAMLQFLRGIEKIASLEQEYNNELLSYLNDPVNMNNPTGFAEHYEAKRQNERLEYMRSEFASDLTEDEMKELAIDQSAFAKRISKLRAERDADNENSVENLEKDLKEAMK